DPYEIPVGIIGCRDDSDRAEIQNRLQKRYPHAEIKICRSMDEYANSLFEFFRHCDSLKLQTIFCQQVDSSGLGRAIMDRLTRASQ
ncbi:MAG: Sua5 family C-terminal domain-containing protein, partial [Pirellula sp.]